MGKGLGMTPRLDAERRTFEIMVRLYCRHKEGNASLCDGCRALIDYAGGRLSRCPFGEDKPTCRLCKVHCYSKDMKRRVCEVMRYAGPRMVLYHPLLAIRHVLREMRRPGGVR